MADSSSIVSTNQILHENGAQNDDVIVLFVPFPAQGHMSPLLQFASLVASYQIPVHFVQSEVHNRMAKLRATTSNTSKIHFHDLPMPPFDSPPPNPSATNKFPEHQRPAFQATMHLRRPFADYIREISPAVKRIVVIHDLLMSYVVQDSGSVPNAATYIYQFSCAYGKLHDCKQIQQRGFSDSGFEKIYSLMASRGGEIINTCRALEGSIMDQITEYEKVKLWAVGPVHAMVEAIEKKPSSKPRHKSLEWLDQQAPRSVLYVAFGTAVSMVDEQNRELALGLEQSGQKFLWLLRYADRGNIFDEDGESAKPGLPQGFEERVEGEGLVVSDWAPQLEILAHPSIGGFLYQGGWNSTQESLCNGVPLLAWPMHSDQLFNARLVTEELRAGLLLAEGTAEAELVEAAVIGEGVKRLMGSKEGGEEVRKRAEEIGVAIRRSIGEGGDSRKELDAFIAHITPSKLN